MKKFIAILLILILGFICPYGYGGSSDELTTSQTVAFGAGCFDGIIIQSDGTNDITLNIYDNTSAAGKKLIPEAIIVTSSTNRYHSIGFDGEPCQNRYSNGIYVEVTTAGTVKYTVYYRG